MLVDFQRALAALTGSVERCREARRAPERLRDEYDLTDQEWRRLVGLITSPGMEANCMLYRANRLAPLALNLPDTCSALGDDLEPSVSSYWAAEPTTDVNFLVETIRFAEHLAARPDLAPTVRDALEREAAVVRAKLDVIDAW